MQKTRILQYNCGKANYKATRPIFDAVSHASHQILAVQEPGYNKHTNTTYCPKGYVLAYDNNPWTKVCFMISRELPIASWSYQPHGQYVAALRVRLEGVTITILNIYNPRNNHAQAKVWDTIEEILSQNRPEDEILLLGDFNIHHPAWGGQRAAREPQGDHLLTATAAHTLRLHTPQGIATWKRGRTESVIDLTFATPILSEKILYCGPQDHWAVTNDHIPIDIAIDHTTKPQPKSKRYALDKANWELILRDVIATHWHLAVEPLPALQTAISEALTAHCPRTRPGPRASPRWTPQAAVLLAGVRRARRRYNASESDQDRAEFRSFRGQLTKELRRVGRANWRRFLTDLANPPEHTPNKGLWQISRWSKRYAGKPPTPPHLPSLRRTESEPYCHTNAEKTQILAEKFFPTTGSADLSDIDLNATRIRNISIPHHITTEQLLSAIQSLPNNKASGPDGIPNEALKIILPEIASLLAQAISNCLASGSIPSRFKESTTIVLRKDQKPDYSLPGSYRPIALENTLAKLIERIVAQRIADAAEKHAILPWNQMGARKQRSTISAIDALNTCVKTAWRARPRCVVSMLSLDLGGAFDNVSHERLLWVLRNAGFPQWTIQFIQSFLTARRTRIAYAGYESDWILTQTGIPQGSPISPILFLFFITELLAVFESTAGDTMAIGFVDDTNLITWGDTAAANCGRLEAAHNKCLAWAKRYGARFAPQKYHLIHFTRRRRDPSGDLASRIHIAAHSIQPETSLTVLGIHVDKDLSWRTHITQATNKGLAAYTALARISASTWGPSFASARLLYSTVVRPTMLYGAQVWGVRNDGEPAANTLLQPLRTLQNRCLRNVTGAYRRTPTAALERETDIPPINLYINKVAAQHAITTRYHPATQQIAATADGI